MVRAATASRSARVAAIYTMASIFVGPAIAFGGFAILTGDGDACDRRCMSNIDGRTAEYLTMSVIHIVGGAAMLAVGIVVLVRLWSRGRELRLWLRLLLTTGILVMMVGYALLILTGFVWATPQSAEKCWG